ncbi:MAG: phosphoesterase [Spirochaetota bacterium]
MKIIYLTDIHDGLRGLKEIFLQTSPDLYLLSGDIIYKAFFSDERIIDFCTVQEEFIQIAKEHASDRLPYDFATMIIRYPEKYDYELGVKAGFYRILFNQAARTMKQKYQLIEKLVKKYARSTCYFLPGNYDIDLQYTALFERDIHRKSMELMGVKFAGYGGAPIATSGIPEKLAVKFHEYTKDGFQYSEPEEFLMNELPDVAVIHNPAYGFLDKIPGLGNVGSQGIRNYIDEYPPSLVVSGHVHEDQGVIKKGNTVFLNPSNFGPVDSVYGFQEGGYFAEIELEGSTVKEVILKQLKNFQIETLIKVNCLGKKLELIYENENSPVYAEDFIRN